MCQKSTCLNYTPGLPQGFLWLFHPCVSPNMWYDDCPPPRGVRGNGRLTAERLGCGRSRSNQNQLLVWCDRPSKQKIYFAEWFSSGLW